MQTELTYKKFEDMIYKYLRGIKRMLGNEQISHYVME